MYKHRKEHHTHDILGYCSCRVVSVSGYSGVMHGDKAVLLLAGTMNV